MESCFVLYHVSSNEWSVYSQMNICVEFSFNQVNGLWEEMFYIVDGIFYQLFYFLLFQQSFFVWISKEKMFCTFREKKIKAQFNKTVFPIRKGGTVW